MIHVRSHTRSRKINYISKVKIEFRWRGAFVFAQRRSSSPSSVPYSRNGRNFKRKFTNEGDFPCTPPSAAFPGGTGGRTGGGEAKRKITRRFSVFRASSSTYGPRDFPGVLSPFFSTQLARASGYGELRLRKMRYRGSDKNSSSRADHNCFRRSFVKCSILASRF